MASQGYRDWVGAGRPYTLIRPAAAVQRNIRQHGITVYDFPDESHQKASTPQDHTPYSVTGFPGFNARWKARALDIMPRSDSKAHRKENADIARQLIRDRDAGVPGAMWIKYLNWTDEQGVCRQERWTSRTNILARTTTSSDDAGHVHVSGRSDVDDDERADGYDPVARMQGKDDDMTPLESQRLTNDNEFLFALTQLTPKASGVRIPSNGTQPPGEYALPLVGLLVNLRDDVAKLTAAAPPAGGALSDVDVERVAKRVLELLKPELEPAAFEGAQRAERE